MERAYDIHFAGIDEDTRVQQRIRKDQDNFFLKRKKASGRKRAKAEIPRKCVQLTKCSERGPQLLDDALQTSDEC